LKPWAVILTVAIGVGLSLSLAACQTEDRTWQQAQSSGMLRVGLDASYPPFEFEDESGALAGFDVDLAREIGQRLDLEVTFVNLAYDGLYDSLQTGLVDVLISALVPLQTVEHKADFSQPYFNNADYLVIPADSGISDMADLEGYAVAVEYGAGGDVEARAWQRRLSVLEIMRFPDPDSALQAVRDGSADAALVDGISARLGVGRYPDLALGAPVNESYFTVAVPDGSQEMLDQINRVIGAVTTDGTTEALIEKWFGPQR
jgi:ABC-type amino acid transport substrate-binding protein